MMVDVFLGLRQDAQSAVKTRLNWDEESQGEYSGPVTNRTAKVFSKMQDRAVRLNLFKKPNLGGNDWNLWIVSFAESPTLLQVLQDELDALTAAYPSQFVIAGAFRWNPGDIACRQVGTQLTIDTRIVSKTWSILNPDYQPDDQEPNFDDRFVLRITGDVEEEYVSGSTGTPTYPLHPQLLQFMPDVDGLPATVLADVNLLQGQPPRSFV